MKLDKDFKEFVELFVANDVRFLVVGGFALAVHGYPRATVDIDGLEVPFIGRDDLLTNKRATGRAKDLADVDYLTNRPGTD